MSLLKFFQIIDRSFVGKFVDRQLKVLDSTNPQRIYVENIRSFYHIPTKMAKFFCEMAVKEQLFAKKYSVNCRYCGRIIMSVNDKSELPQNIVCDTCQLEEREKYEFTPDKRDIIEFYQLVR